MLETEENMANTTQIEIEALENELMELNTEGYKYVVGGW